jgi:hypothetical protein
MERICIKCKNHYMGGHLDEGEHMCSVYVLPSKMNYITGVRIPSRDAYCDTINKDGNCPEFKKK